MEKNPFLMKPKKGHEYINFLLKKYRGRTGHETPSRFTVIIFPRLQTTRDPNINKRLLQFTFKLYFTALDVCVLHMDYYEIIYILNFNVSNNGEEMSPWKII